jgi:hypothetical protein
MKKSLLFLSIVITLNSTAQSILFNEGNISFDDSASRSYVKIDTSLSKNIWQIGRPDKLIFNNSYSGQMSIITDSINYYDTNSTSYFYNRIIVGGGNGWIIEFNHKYDTDSLKDGGTIDISFDNGITWMNIFSYIGNCLMCSNLNNIDTISDLGILGYTGQQTNWVHERIDMYDKYNFSLQSTVDTVIVRYGFYSDNIPDNKEGWIIDDIEYSYYFIDYISEKNQIDFKISITPNPITTTSMLYVENEELGNEHSLSVVDQTGKTVIETQFKGNEFNIGKAFVNQPSGIYIVHVRNKDICTSIKVFK